MSLGGRLYQPRTSTDCHGYTEYQCWSVQLVGIYVTPTSTDWHRNPEYQCGFVQSVGIYVPRMDTDCPPKLLPPYAAHTQVFFSLKINFRPFFFVYMRAMPSRRVAMLYLRTPPALRAFPRSYCHPTQPICKQISPKSKLFAHLFANVHIFLYLCALIWNGVLHSQQIRIPLN